MGVCVAATRRTHRQGHGAGRKRHRGNDGADVRFEQVGAHAGDVAHVVANVVGDDAGVAGVVFGDSCLDLTHKVRSDIGGFGEDATTHSGEQSYRTGAEPEAGDHAYVLENQVQDGNAQQADPHDRHAHDCAAGEGNPQGGVQTSHGGCSSADVGPYRDVHSDETGGTGADGAHQVGYGRRRGRNVMLEDRVIQNSQNHRYDHNEWQEGHVFPTQKRAGAFADCVADAAHQVIAGFGFKHPHGGNSSKK